MTRYAIGKIKEYIISTHTLTWSVTFLTEKNGKQKRISTHTLTWSVTLHIIDWHMIVANFNSHAHVERDGMSLAKTADDLTFQLTRSRGA